MEYKNIFEIEFIQRTQEIVNGYQIPFENTLFINACVGLLIIPQQSLFNHLPTEVVSADKWGIADTYRQRMGAFYGSGARLFRFGQLCGAILFRMQRISLLFEVQYTR